MRSCRAPRRGWSTTCSPTIERRISRHLSRGCLRWRARRTTPTLPTARRPRSSTLLSTPMASAARSRRRSRPSRDRSYRRAVPRSASALGRHRLDGVQQQGQAGPPVRAVLQRDPPLRIRRADRCESDPVLRSGRASGGHAAPEPHLAKRSSSIRGSRRPGTSTTRCWSTIRRRS